MTKTKHTEFFEKLLVGFCQEEDPIREMMEWMIHQLMEVEVSTLKTEVEKGKHSTQRKTHRNGYRVRRWDTRMGTIYLTIPKVRSGGYQPFFLVNRQPAFPATHNEGGGMSRAAKIAFCFSRSSATCKAFPGYRKHSIISS